FVLGIEIGKHIIVEELFPVNFQEDNIDAVYQEVIDKKGEKLIGPFFKRAVPAPYEGPVDGISDQVDQKVYSFNKRSQSVSKKRAAPAPYKGDQSENHEITAGFIEKPVQHINKRRTASPGPFFLSDWFIGDIIMEIGDKKSEFYLYEGEN
ncbi:MAG: hypothetical protein KAW12_26885, partial [Candidatus Aminicenantes bacterium]|nr:hypothetical protein [Candidatus Aminicenantes bacterium]